MKLTNAILPLIAISALVFVACANDDDTTGAGGNGGGTSAGKGGTNAGGDGTNAGGSGGGSSASCTGEKVTTGGEVGQCCDKANYQQTCSADKKTALVCWDTKGVSAVQQWDCADNDCKPNLEAGKEKQVVCKKECKLPEKQTTSKSYTEGEPCPDEFDNGNVKGLCKEDKSEGYYCKKDPKDNTKKVIAVKKCAKNDCILVTDSSKCGFVSCKDGGNTNECTGEKVQTGGDEGQCCDRADYQATCINNNANALVCHSGQVKKWACKDNQCKPKSDKPKEVSCPKP